MSEQKRPGRFPAWGTVPTRPRCHYCGNVIVVDMHAEDELWCAVMRDKFGSGYACVNCFASRADEKLIDWAPHVQLRPLSLVAQMALQDGQADSCEWRELDPWGDMPGTYESACGEAWSFTEGGVTENSVRFCQSCGKPVKVVPCPPPALEDKTP